MKYLDIPDAHVGIQQLLPSNLTETYYRDLFTEISGYLGSTQIFVFGKWTPIPRQQAGFGDPNTTYKYSGAVVSAADWSDKTKFPTLHKIKALVESAIGQTTNFVLINLYRDGKDSIGWHSDDEKDLGTKPTIASFTLGATRDFQLRPKPATKKRAETNKQPIPTDRTIPLQAGTLLTMEHPTNANYFHCVPRRLRVKKPRLNLTFRIVQ